MPDGAEQLITVDTDQRIVTPSNPLIINSPAGNYGEVIIEGGYIQVVVPASQVQFTSLTKQS
jgi:hypothetical protein